MSGRNEPVRKERQSYFGELGLKVCAAMASSCCLFSSHPFLDPVPVVDMLSDGTQQLGALCPKSRESPSTPISEVLALA